METASPHQPKSLYDASVGEIALKHFFAGFMHGLGGLAVTLISWGFIYVIFVQLVLPQISGILTQAQTLLQSVEKVNSALVPQKSGTDSGSGQNQEIVIPSSVLEQLQNLQKRQP